MPLSRARLVSFTALVALLCLAPAAGAQRPNAMSSVNSRDTTTKEYLGAYQRGFEQSWFIPCESAADDKRWWVTLTDEALAQRDSMLAKLTAPATNGLAVRWRATISERMPAGHMGGGTRYMLVTKILDMRPLPDAGACGVRS
jgi:hypothetical protein